MWNIAAQAGTGMAIAGLSATYYALIRKNVEMENRAMDNLAADIQKEDEGNGNEGREDISGSRSEYRMPTTASQNLLRKNFQLMAKESGRIFGINVANSNALLAERNRSESHIDHIVNRTETFASKSAVALYGAQKSKSDFDVLRTFTYQKLTRKESSLDLHKNKSGFDVDTFCFGESSSESLSQEQGANSSMPIQICHCKYSASAEDIYVSPSRKEIESEKCIKDEKPHMDVSKANSPMTVCLPHPVSEKLSTKKQMQGSLLSDDYIPRLENREIGTHKLSLSATTRPSKRYYPSQEKNCHPSTQLVSISKIPRLLKNGIKNNLTSENVSEKSPAENAENARHNPYETCNDDEFPPTENLLTLKVGSEIGDSLRVPDDSVRFSTSDLKSCKKDHYRSSEYSSSSMFSLPDLNAFSFTVQQPPVEIKDNNHDVPYETKSNDYSPCIIELGTTNTFQMIKRDVSTPICAIFRALFVTAHYVVTIPFGAVIFFAVVIIALAIFVQIIQEADLFQESNPNPADSAFPEQTLL